MEKFLIRSRTPEQCPSVVSLLAESYNPHVRYGAAMALGIACAGTGLKEAIALLDPMTNDSVNFVRQGALIASAMILIQQTEATCPRVKDFRALYAKVVVDKHEDVMAKFGAILAQGIIDAGEYLTILGTLNGCFRCSISLLAGIWYRSSIKEFLISRQLSTENSEIEESSVERWSWWCYWSIVQRIDEEVDELLSLRSMDSTCSDGKRIADLFYL